MLREMQREVNMNYPFERRLHIDYPTNNHPTQLHAAKCHRLLLFGCPFVVKSQQDPES